MPSVPCIAMLTTNEKGLLAENAVIRECVLHEIEVAVPLNDARYDLIFDLDGRLLRVQCKWAVRFGDVVVFRGYTSRRGPNGMIVRRYTAEEVDLFAGYCEELRTCYLLPAAEFAAKRTVHLRLAPSRNNQVAGINWARDFEFAATLSRLNGPIAQLGERLAGSQKVAGSSPAGSTDIEAA